MTTNTLFIVLIFLGIIIIILLYENTSTRIIFHGYGSTTDSKLFARSHNRVQLTSNNAVSGFYHIRTYEYNVSNSDYQLTMKTGPYSMLTTKIRPIEMLTTKKLLNGCGSQRPDNMSDSEFCKEVSRRLHWGLVDYALWDGDPELKQLVQPLFKNKRLVVWSLDHHAMAIAELRSIIESFGVEFIEHSVLPLHTRRPGVCSPPLCLCSQSTNLTPDPSLNPLFPTKDLFDKVARDPLAAPDIARADAFLVSVSIPIIELYMRYNRSIIAVAATRFEYTLYRDTNRWHKMNEQLRTLLQKRHHVIGGNSLYEVEYMYYYMGARPDYIPGFGVYTGEHYHPTRMSFLYARRPKVYKVGSFWTDPFDRQYRLINAKFVIKSIMELYPPLCGGGYTLFDLAQHLGIVHLPYQVSVMSFFEQYGMGIPLFAPSLNFLTQLHINHWFVGDRSYRGRPERSSLISHHPDYNGTARVPAFNSSVKTITLDPHDDYNTQAVRHWLSLSDYYTFPYVVLFESAEHLVDILQLMWRTPSLLQSIHEKMQLENRSRLKSLLRYWRQRLLDIAQYSPHRPN